ncbi:tryptophan 2,3-dioxygenase family protein [Pseudonocardia sp. CA-107938]|uniref:tryptophan 2,3-dioxygenase family protein n=1 Tax=Pseudonocardia sp. CA-107938 TaxID=3240021 RepID=UPI003D8A94DD
MDDHTDGLALARHVAARVRAVGSAALPASFLAELDALRDRGTGPHLRAFLDSVLARRDGRFVNRHYLALPLLELVGLDPDRLAALLMADVVRHELHNAGSPDSPAPDVLRKRVRHARRFVGRCLGETVEPACPLDGLPDAPAAGWLDLTVLPVSTRHDEHFFIRSLQCHELTFTVLVADVRAATAALRAGDVDGAVAHLDHAGTVFERAQLLFRIVATMSADAFADFRTHTEGASAVQSDQYKRFEVACGRPRAERLASMAFDGVPAVRAEALAGGDDLSRALLDVPPTERLTAAVRRLEAAHQRWKATHRSLAARMLGDRPGSGYSSGVPYLGECLRNRLFWRVGGVDGAAS